jgi:hypothetical protein
MKQRHTLKIIVLLICSFLLNNRAESQVLISSAGGTPLQSAMLEIRSTNSGLLIPRMFTSQRTSISNPQNGLLVYDTDLGSFFLYGRNASGSLSWINLSTSSEIWSQNTTGAYLINTSLNLGVGTSPLIGKKVVIKADPLKSVTDPLFEVQDQYGKPIMRVTSEGVRFYVKSYSKGASGGFAVGKYGIAKDDSIKGSNDLLTINYNGTRIYTDGSGGTGSGFAIGQFDAGTENFYFSSQKDSTRVYVQEALKGSAGGFAVGKYGIAKYGGKNNYLYMMPKNYFIGHQAGNTLQNSVYTGQYNTFFGYQSGYKDQTGSNNIFIGYKSGYENIIGKYNVFLGNQAGYKNTGTVSGPDTLGSRNVFLGYQSGLSNTTGYSNVFIGNKSGYSNTQGFYNVFMGNQSGFSNTYGEYNVFLGNNAGYKNLGTNTTDYEGNANVFIGYEAGYSNTNGYTNVMMGYNSGRNNILGYANVFLGFQSGMANNGGSNNLFLGYQSGRDIANSSGNTFLGVNAGVTATGGNNNIFIGSRTGEYQSTGDNNIYLGNFAGGGQSSSVRNQGTENIFIGTQTGNHNTSGNNNVYAGYYSGFNNTIGRNNVFLGNYSGYSNTQGIKNVIIGDSAGYNNVFGYNNVYIGTSAGKSDNGGNQNVMIGDQAGKNADGQYNTFIGYRAGLNDNGFSNVFLGNGAGSGNVAGYRNTYLGTGAGEKAVNGNENVFIGEFSGYYHTNGGNNVFIGSAAASNDINSTNNVIIGDMAASYSNATGGNTDIGDANVILGKDAGYNSTAGNNVGSSNVFLGSQAGLGTASDYNVFIGYQAGYERTGGNLLCIENNWSHRNAALIDGNFAFRTLNVNGTFTFNAGINSVTLPTTRGTAGYVLTTDALGGTSWTSKNASADVTTASNGLTEVVNDIQLGGTLSSLTTINQGANNMIFNLNSTGDFNVQDNGGPAFIVTDAANVGIGTNTPYCKLDVNNVIRAGGNTWPTSGEGLEMAYNTATNIGYIQAYDRTNLLWGAVHIGGNTNPVNNSTFDLGSSTLRWNSFYAVNGYYSGNVGIGNDAPNSRLHISSLATEDPFRVQIGGSSRLFVSRNGGVSIGTFEDNPPSRGLYVYGNVGVGTATPIATLDVNGSLAMNLNTINADYTITNTDSYYTLICNTSTNTITVTLPTASTNNGRVLIIKRVGVNSVTIDVQGSETIDGAVSRLLNANYRGVVVQSDGINWFVISST